MLTSGKDLYIFSICQKVNYLPLSFLIINIIIVMMIFIIVGLGNVLLKTDDIRKSENTKT